MTTFTNTRDQDAWAALQKVAAEMFANHKEREARLDAEYGPTHIYYLGIPYLADTDQTLRGGR